jgi:enoyl-CoA hydratase/carnithine racemase
MSARKQPPSFNWITERELFVKLFDGDNQKEGVNAFLEKRSPKWT